MASWELSNSNIIGSAGYVSSSSTQKILFNTSPSNVIITRTEN